MAFDAFIENPNSDQIKPTYPYVAMRIPEGRAIVGSNSGGDRKEGIIKGEIAWVPVNPLDVHQAVTHLAFLKEKKGYDYVEHNFHGQLTPEREARMMNLIGRWRPVQSAAVAEQVAEVKSGRKRTLESA